MNITETIAKRRSVRTFAHEPISETAIAELKKAIAEIETPFGDGFTIRLRQFDIKGDFKPSTYGVIKGASDYLLMAMTDHRDDILGAGYGMEQVVLRATELGLGTCWIAATFRGTDFDKENNWPDGEQLKIVSPVGIPAKKMTLFEKVARVAVRSNNRKSRESMFFNKNTDNPLTYDSTFAQSLEMMRLAPSSTNSQPWRAVVKGDMVHFYSVSDKDIAILNIGIGLCHFDLTEHDKGHQGVFEKLSPSPEVEKWHYVISYRRIG